MGCRSLDDIGDGMVGKQGAHHEASADFRVSCTQGCRAQGCCVLHNARQALRPARQVIARGCLPQQVLHASQERVSFGHLMKHPALTMLHQLRFASASHVGLACRPVTSSRGSGLMCIESTASYSSIRAMTWLASSPGYEQQRPRSRNAGKRAHLQAECPRAAACKLEDSWKLPGRCRGRLRAQGATGGSAPPRSPGPSRSAPRTGAPSPLSHPSHTPHDLVDHWPATLLQTCVDCD